MRLLDSLLSSSQSHTTCISTEKHFITLSQLNSFSHLLHFMWHTRESPNFVLSRPQTHTHTLYLIKVSQTADLRRYFSVTWMYKQVQAVIHTATYTHLLSVQTVEDAKYTFKYMMCIWCIHCYKWHWLILDGSCYKTNIEPHLTPTFICPVLFYYLAVKMMWASCPWKTSSFFTFPRCGTWWKTRNSMFTFKNKIIKTIICG